MSEKISGMVSKFSKWCVLRLELKFDKALPECDSNLEKRMLYQVFDDGVDKIHLRNQVVNIIILGISIVSAVLSFLGFIK